MYIWTKNEYVQFTKKLSKLEVKKKVYLRLVKVEKDTKKEDF